MITVKKEGVLLIKSNLGFEIEGVLNPAVIKAADGIHIFYRAVGKGNYSTIGHCLLKDPLTVDVRQDMPVLYPQAEYESQGMEDPRIVKIDETYYLTYTAYDGVNAMGALATSTDLHHFEKKGIIVPQITYAEFNHLASSKDSINDKYLRYNLHEGLVVKQGKHLFVWDKNLVFFPRRINGRLYFLHRIRPDIQIASVQEIEDLTTEYWQHYLIHFNEHILITPQFKHEVSYVGGGCPPIETPQGWLMIYHGVHDTVNGYVYSACAALLDLMNPSIVIARLPYPLFQPEEDWELKGMVNNVCFPTGCLVQDDRLYIYYGAADEQIACASVSITVLIAELLQHHSL